MQTPEGSCVVFEGGNGVVATSCTKVYTIIQILEFNAHKVSGIFNQVSKVLKILHLR